MPLFWHMQNAGLLMTQLKYYVYVTYMVSFSIMSMISPVSTDIRPAKPLYLGLILVAFPLHKDILYMSFLM